MNRTTERRRLRRSTWLGALMIVGLSGLGIMGASPAVAATDVSGTPAGQVVDGGDAVTPLADDEPDPEDPCILDPLDPSCTPIEPVDPCILDPLDPSCTPIDPVDPCVANPAAPECATPPVDTVDPADPVDPVDPVETGDPGDDGANMGAEPTDNSSDRTRSKIEYRTPNKSQLAETGPDVASAAWLAGVAMVAGGGLLIARRLRARTRCCLAHDARSPIRGPQGTRH